MENSTTLWTHEFKPWGRANSARDDTICRASDAYWKKPLKWNREAAEIVSRCNECGRLIPASVTHHLGVEDCGLSPFQCPGIPSIDRPRVFCASLADVFDDWDGPIVYSGGAKVYASDRPEPANMDDLRRDLFDLIDQTPNLDWLLLTKRPENIRRMWAEKDVTAVVQELPRRKRTMSLGGVKRDNVWLGCSVSDQETLFKIGCAKFNWLDTTDIAAKIFLSMEPLLGPVDFPSYWLHDIDWVIVGGESGPKARPCDIEWIRDIVGQCKAADVPCWVKQLGSKPRDPEYIYGLSIPVQVRERQGADPSEWPEDLRVQQLPNGVKQC